MTVAATTWAMSQTTGSPLNKLSLMALSDWCDASGAWLLNVPKLAAFCEATDEAVEDSLSDLSERGFLLIVGAAVQIAFFEDRVQPSPGLGTPSWRIAKAKRYAIYARDRHACVYCGSGNMLSLDHVVPRSKGGEDTPENLVTACQPCNSSKRDRDLTEWRGRA